MEVENVPDWLTADFLKTCLESDAEHFQNIIITNHIVERAVPPGNNYGSHMFRVKVEYTKQGKGSKTQAISLIVKAPLTNLPKEMSAFFEEVSKKEPKYYNEFINETYKLCKHDIVPKHYVSPNPRCVVLEDLCASGYVMADRHKLLDFDQCQHYTKALAKLHALSMAIYKTKPEMIESLVEDPMKNEFFKHIMKGMLTMILQCVIAFLKDKPDLKEYLDFFKEAEQNDSLCKVYEEMMISNASRPLKALVPGDPWCTNMMFKYNSAGEVVGVKIFDFQGLKLISPVENFLTFVWASANSEVKETKLHDLYQIYCDSLNKSFAELGSPEMLSINELKEEINSLIPSMLIVVTSLVPLALTDGPVNMNDFFTASTSEGPVTEKSIYKMYESPRFKKYFPGLLRLLSKEGVFDYLRKKMNSLK